MKQKFRNGAADALDNSLAEVRKLLESNVPVDERERAGLLWYALARLESPLRQQSDPATAATGPDSEVDHTRNTLHRRHEKLTLEHHNLLEQCLALKWEMYSAAQPFTPEEPLGKIPPLRKNEEGTTTPDFGVEKRRIHQFLNDLEEQHALAAALVLESVTTDIGAGD